jgi:predicted RNA-binding protein YlqC (UPF0109 family)
MPQEQQTVDEQILILILNNLVTEPESVQIIRKIDEQGVLLSVIVNAADMGIVVGRNGSMASAIKTIMRAVGKAHQMNIRVQILEPDGSTRYTKEDKPEISENSYSSPKIDTPSEETNSLEDDLKDFVVN